MGLDGVIKFVFFLIIFAFVIRLSQIIFLKLRIRAYRRDTAFNKNNYRSKRLVTPNEYILYVKLKKIAESHNVTLMCMVRLADVFETTADKYNKIHFDYISRKHIDFIFYSNELRPIIAIELQDPTHLKKSRQNSDNIKRSIFDSSYISFIEINSSSISYEELEQNITKTLQDKREKYNIS